MMDAHLPLPDVNDKPLTRPPPSPIEKTGGAEPIASKIDTAHSVQKDAHLPRPPKNHPFKKPSKGKKKKKKMKYHQRHSSHCGGKQLKCNGEQNAETQSPDIGNPVIEVHTNGLDRSVFKYRDGSMVPLDLWLSPGQSAKVFKVPVGQVAQVILHYQRNTNALGGISMVDRKGNTLFKTYDSTFADASHTISLEEGESIVGFRSHAFEGKYAFHYDFQLIIAKMVETESDESDE
jgi:hypothetical protein